MPPCRFPTPTRPSPRSLEALDDLHLDGVGLLTHHGDVYLGDPRLDAVFDELNRRAATVFVHPTSPLCCGEAFLDIPRPTIEFIFDTARAVMNLILPGTLDRCLTSGGSSLTAGERSPRSVPNSTRCTCSRLDADRPGKLGRVPPAPLLRPRRPTNRQRCPSAARGRDESRLLYGSDWPFTPDPAVAGMLTTSRGVVYAQADEALADLLERAAPRG